MRHALAPALLAGVASAASICTIAAVATVAAANYPSDPAVNLPVVVKQGEQVLPKTGVLPYTASPPGGMWVGWFDNAGGSYRVYVQLLDPSGTPFFPAAGLLVSANPQSSSLVDWDLAVDNDGNAILVFTDTRSGGDLDVFAYKIDPSGQFLWGPNGIELSLNPDFDPSPMVTMASDGDAVVVWGRFPDTGDGDLRMQRIAADGSVRFAAGGIAIASATGETPGFADLVPSDGGSVIVSYVRDVDTFTAPRHVRALKISPTGTSVWGSPVVVFDAAAVPIAHWPKIQEDGVGGAVFVWHRSISNLFNSCVQHLTSAGAELFAHNGVVVCTTANRHHLDPDFTYLPATGDTYVFWNERNSAQSQWGIFGQKITASGARAWGDGGISYIPLDNVLEILPRVVTVGNDAMVLVADEPGGAFNQDRVLAFRVDTNGANVWAGSPRVVSSVLSSKSRLPVVVSPDGIAYAVWEDNRNGTPDLYAQNVNPDGTLGPNVGSDVPESAARFTARLVASPNPFTGETTITLTGAQEISGPMQVYDASGRLRLQLVPTADGRVRWAGRDGDGSLLPGGVYFLRMATPGRTNVRGSMTLLR